MGDIKQGDKVFGSDGELYDVVGHIVKTLVNEVKSEGTYSIEFSSAGLADGVYYCRMINGNINQVIRMIKMD